MRRYLVFCLLSAFSLSAISTDGRAVQERRGNGPVRYVSKYGFCLPLPEDWRGYSVLVKQWDGVAPGCSQGNCTVAQGPKVILRNPRWTAAHPYEDIPIMVFTPGQWRALQKEKFIVSAAPFGPKEMGRNGRYVFGLPPRYNYDFSEGWKQVEEILHGFHASCDPRNGSAIEPQLRP